MMVRATLAICLAVLSGCGCFPTAVKETCVHNPFPQLMKVAVAPFFNLTSEPASVVDGRQFGLAYYNELQRIPGFEVVPIGVVEEALRAHGLSLDRPADARKLAQILHVDAVAVGAVTDFTPYYPPRCALAVEWYAADPAFQPVPPGYGLPWGTCEEKEIPQRIVFDADLVAARADYEMARDAAAHAGPSPLAKEGSGAPVPPGASPSLPLPEIAGVRPVVRHVATYNGQDADVTAALEEYVCRETDARPGSWPAYLQRSDDFIRFCCYRHLHELLAARGGAESRVVWRWPPCR
jgi:hypothetical protein